MQAVTTGTRAEVPSRGAARGAWCGPEILADVECTLVWTNGPFVWSQRPFRPIGDPSRPEVP